MGELEELARLPDDFSGVVRLFPLPNLVMFPHVMQPLHIFEPRYREMVADAMAGDRLLAISLLEDGWPNDYEGRPPVYEVGCLGKIATCHRLDDGRYNLMLLGLRRVRLVRELEPRRSFREFQVDLLDDLGLKTQPERQRELHEKLTAAFRQMLPTISAAADRLEDLLDSSIPLALLTDVISYTLNLSPCVKQDLLAELCVERRACRLLDQMAAHLKCPPHPIDPRSGFPPPFSEN